jgi:environmental stress-induced protein Ves
MTQSRRARRSPFPRLIDAHRTPPQAWRNGGGQTRELLAWPGAQDWQLRISRADITQDGPFSAFAGVQRWFTVLEGAGVALHFPAGTQHLRAGDPPCDFDGALAPGCDLLAGPTQDLNLMARGGACTMQAWRAGETFACRHAMAGLYTLAPGRWTAGQATVQVPAGHLLWVDDTAAMQAADWHFSPDAPAPHTVAWWMGFTPAT